MNLFNAPHLPYIYIHTYQSSIQNTTFCTKMSDLNERTNERTWHGTAHIIIVIINKMQMNHVGRIRLDFILQVDMCVVCERSSLMRTSARYTRMFTLIQDSLRNSHDAKPHCA